MIELKVSGRTTVIVIVAVATLAVAAGFYTADIWKRDPSESEYGDVTIEEAIALMEEKPDLMILDVRTVSEYEAGHIEGAINIPVGDLGVRLDELSKEEEILVYCRTGNRSGTAMEIMDNAGFTKLYHMYQGISVWTQEGHPVVQ